MTNFFKINLNKRLQNAISDLGFVKQTPIQKRTYSKILSGKDLVGIAQTGTGKTLAIVCRLFKVKLFNPENQNISFGTTGVLQVVETLENLTEYVSCRIVGVYGGTNMNIRK